VDSETKEDREQELEKEKQKTSVPADDAQTNCPVCGERFDQFWDAELDEWMYKDAMVVENEDAGREPSGKTGTIYHYTCHLDRQQQSRPSNVSAQQLLTQPLSSDSVVDSQNSTEINSNPLPSSTAVAGSLTPDESQPLTTNTPMETASNRDNVSFDDLPPLEEHERPLPSKRSFEPVCCTLVLP
jgi:hypothetical protein